jgi:hypothetical protein
MRHIDDPIDFAPASVDSAATVATATLPAGSSLLLQQHVYINHSKFINLIIGTCHAPS